MASVVPMKSLLEAGVHFGHRTRRWNPKMKPFIFTERNGIHIIDLQQTIARLNGAYDLVRDTIAANGVVLFVGTKRQAQENIVKEASRCHMPYVDQRWLGGTLTNWRTIRQRIDYLLEIEKQQARGEFTRLVKKEALMKEREIARLNHRLGGLKEMRRLPNLLFVVDVRRDSIAVKEANILGIPVIAMVDTNCDPDPIDHIIPSNDDAIRAIKLMLTTMASAVLEGQAILNTIEAEEEEAAELEGEQAQERYLGPSTIAKIQAKPDPEAPETAEKAPDTTEAGSMTEETAPEEPAPSPAAAEIETPAAEETAAETKQPVEEAAAEEPTAAEQPAEEATSEEKTTVETETAAEAEPTTEQTPAAETPTVLAAAESTPETAEEKDEEPAAALEEAVIERKEG